MIKILQAFWKKWSDWTGDHDLEVAIRRHLTTNGYFGQTAKIANVRLAAVQRPGWLQVYRFEVTARVNPAGSQSDDEPEPVAEYQLLFGLVREDARKEESTVRAFENEAARRELFQLWSEGLLQLRGGRL